MKFERTLEFNCVPEWRDKYLNYAALRKIIEKIAACSEEFELKSNESSISISSSDSMTIRSSFHVATAELSFERLFRQELKKVSDFYLSERHACLITISKFSTGSGLLRRRSSFNEDLSSSSLSLIKPHSNSIIHLHVSADALEGIYLTLHDLLDFLQLNYTGFNKIIKKHDKYCFQAMRHILLAEVDLALPQTDVMLLYNLLADIEQVYAMLECEGSLEESRAQLKRTLRARLILARSNVWQDMVAMERKVAAVSVINPDVDEDSEAVPVGAAVIINHAYKLLAILGIFLLSWLTPIMPTPIMSRALAVSVLCVILWATEYIPLFVTAMASPFMIVVMRVLKNPMSDEPLLPGEAAIKIVSVMFSQVILMLLGGFSIAAATSKYGLTREVACRLLKCLGQNNGLLILGIMLLSLTTSALISNVASPILCFSILGPLFKGLPLDSPLSRQLVLSVAIASNIGGMISPISSPQNIIAYGSLDSIGTGISWLTWLSITLPVCIASLLMSWSIIFYGYPKTKAFPRNLIFFHHTAIHFGAKEMVILITTFLTITSWCCGSISTKAFGSMGIMAIFPMLVFFGSGILSKDDFNSFPWHVIMLAMGGLALGEAIKSSGLLKLIADLIINIIPSSNLFFQSLMIGLSVTIATCFVSHTVGALIFIPMIEALEDNLGPFTVRLLLMTASLSCSAGMMMPVSSFPNITAMAQEDGTGKGLISKSEFIRVGFLCTVASWICICSLGFVLMKASF